MDKSEFCYKLHDHVCDHCPGNEPGGRIVSFMHGNQEVFKCSSCSFMRPQLNQVCCCGGKDHECVSHEDASRLGLLDELDMLHTGEQQTAVVGVDRDALAELRSQEGRDEIPF